MKIAVVFVLTASLAALVGWLGLRDVMRAYDALVELQAVERSEGKSYGPKDRAQYEADGGVLWDAPAISTPSLATEVTPACALHNGTEWVGPCAGALNDR